MDYMFLIYNDPARTYTPEEKQQISGKVAAIIEETTRLGILKGVSPLAPVSTAMTARSRDGVITLTDGPFAETKEILAGYFLIDCSDLEEAKFWAHRIVDGGCCSNMVEFRALRPLPAPVVPADEPALANA